MPLKSYLAETIELKQYQQIITVCCKIKIQDATIKAKHNHTHDDVIKWKHFPRHWPFVRGIHWSPVNSPHKGQWCGALMFSLICAWINAWVNNREAGDLRRHRSHYDVTVMVQTCKTCGRGPSWTPLQRSSYNNIRYCEGAHRSLQVYCIWWTRGHTDDLVWDCSISIANALDILQSCTKPSIYHLGLPNRFI